MLKNFMDVGRRRSSLKWQYSLCLRIWHVVRIRLFVPLEISPELFEPKHPLGILCISKFQRRMAANRAANWNEL
jgi:hypothetical protein